MEATRSLSGFNKSCGGRYFWLIKSQNMLAQFTLSQFDGGEGYKVILFAQMKRVIF
jgi:hypothetical protein